MTDTPLKGFIAHESDDELRVDVFGGTWIIQRSDLDAVEDWKGGEAFARSGKPVELTIRPGATISLLTTFTLQQLDRPMTLAKDPAKPVIGDEYTDRSRAWGNSYGFEYDEKMAEAAGGSTVCCWDEGGTHGVCKRDDCG